MTCFWRGVGRPGRQWHERSGTGALVGELPIGKLEVNGGAVAGGGGEFQCAAVYPTPEQSLQLGRQNLHLFRFKNTRFDVIGGAFYFLMVVRPCHPFPFPVCLKVACPILHCILETCSHISASWSWFPAQFKCMHARCLNCAHTASSPEVAPQCGSVERHACMHVCGRQGYTSICN